MTTLPITARRSPLRCVLLGGLTVGSLDLVFAFSFWGLLRGTAPARILQSIASGLLGKAAFTGGAGTALLGAACHYFIATMMVLAYYLASARAHRLVDRPTRFGAPYGLLLYATMTWVVVPLSQAAQPTKVYLPWVAASIMMHVVFGILCAWFARWARLSG